MKVMNIIQDSIVDGEGLRTVIFFAGCSHRCKGCHNPESWNIRNGKEMSLEEIINEACKNPLSDITFSGGDPIYQVEELQKLAKMFKAKGKDIWCYTGYTLQQLLDKKDKNVNELLKNIDVLVDGKFILEQRDTTLLFKGSKNQKIIYMKDLQNNIDFI